MLSEVYAKGEIKVPSDRIETVAVREQGRPRRPRNESAEEDLYRGTVVTDPAAVLREVAQQVEAEATSRVVGDRAALEASCPWREHVPAQAPLEPQMLEHLLGPEGRSLFGLTVARMPDRAPGTDGVTNQVWKNMPPALLDRVWDYFCCCIRKRDIHAALIELTTVLLYKGKGNPLWLENWRPIALAKTVYKLFSTVLTDALSEYLKRHQILSWEQEGFQALKRAQPLKFIS